MLAVLVERRAVLSNLMLVSDQPLGHVQSQLGIYVTLLQTSVTYGLRRIPLSKSTTRLAFQVDLRRVKGERFKAPLAAILIGVSRFHYFLRWLWITFLSHQSSLLDTIINCIIIISVLNYEMSKDNSRRSSKNRSNFLTALCGRSNTGGYRYIRRYQALPKRHLAHDYHILLLPCRGLACGVIMAFWYHPPVTFRSFTRRKCDDVQLLQLSADADDIYVTGKLENTQLQFVGRFHAEAIKDPSSPKRNVTCSRYRQVLQNWSLTSLTRRARSRDH